ncbi:MraY family glycosyltransferase [Spiribacter pallidus]|uniref:Glycosyltransferase family 4 protein n=1 Tax=Spiribacter pallidus TaxID=1987936 RepID=A0ABV3TCN9_9GAMM
MSRADAGIALIWLAPALWIAVGLAAVFTGALRGYALRHSMLDIPNARSSHSVPTPRGGGLAIVAVTFLGLPLMALTGWISPAQFLMFVGAAGLVAAVGWLDDRMGVAPVWRIGVHGLAAAWALLWLGGLPPLALAGDTHDLGWLGDGLAWIYLLWMINLFNFMDGINGIAGMQALSVAGGLALISLVLGPHPAVVAVGGLIAAASLGFLPWNFPAGRIFMGDAGSGFLGLCLGLLTLLAGHIQPLLLWAGIGLASVFWVDATLTLIMRLLRGERVHEAHRSHAYQHAAARLGHTRVTLAVFCFNLGVLWPTAFAIGSGAVAPMGLPLVVPVALVGLAAWLGSGRDAA